MHAFSPAHPAVRGHVFQHAGMLKHEYRTPEFTRQACAMLHLAGEQLQLEQQMMFRKMREAAPPLQVVHDFWMRREPILRTFVPMDLLPDSPCRRKLRETSDQRCAIGI